MRREEFAEQMGRLQEVYGERYYPDARVAGIWKIVADLSQWQFSQVVDHLIEDCATVPLAPKIREAARPFLDAINERKRKELDDQLQIQNACRYCNNSGTIIADRIDDQYQGTYAFRCPNCQAAKLRVLSQKIPLWSEEFASSYRPHFHGVTVVYGESRKVNPRALASSALKPMPKSESLWDE